MMISPDTAPPLRADVRAEFVLVKELFAVRLFALMETCNPTYPDIAEKVAPMAKAPAVRRPTSIPRTKPRVRAKRRAIAAAM